MSTPKSERYPRIHIMSSSPWLDKEVILSLIRSTSPTRVFGGGGGGFPILLLLFLSITLVMGASDVPSFFFPSFVRHWVTNHPKQTKKSKNFPSFFSFVIKSLSLSHSLTNHPKQTKSLKISKYRSSQVKQLSKHKVKQKVKTYYNEKHIKKKLKVTQGLACFLFPCL